MDGGTDNPIIIIGAGIGGLVTALALAQRGFAVEVYERREAPMELSAGMALGPNATRVLEALGLKEFLAFRANIPYSSGQRHWQTGEVLLTNLRGGEPNRRYGASFYQIVRTELYEELLRLVRADVLIKLHFGKALAECKQVSDSVILQFEDGDMATARLLIGADGANSKVRSALFQDTAPRFSGKVAYRGMVPFKLVPAETMDIESARYIGPGRYFERFFVCGRKLVSFLAICEQQEWSSPGFHAQASKEELLDKFDNWNRSIVCLIAANPPENLQKTAVLESEALPHLAFGRVALIGDAAHTMLPFMGQGAAMAIEDGMVLARCVSACMKMEYAIMRYDNARRERVNTVSLGSRMLGENYFSFDGGLSQLYSGKDAERSGFFDYHADEISV